MSVHPTSPQFKANAKKALADTQLQRALGNVKKGFIEKRRAAADRLPGIRGDARFRALTSRITLLAHLDLYLERYEEKVRESGGHVPFCPPTLKKRARLIP